MRFPILFCVAALGILIALAHARGASPRYSVTPLRTIATAVGTYTTPHDINDYGVAVGVEGGTPISGGPSFPPTVDWTKTRPMMWDAAGAPTALPTLPGKGGEALAINNSGLIVGYSAAATGGHASTIFSGASATAIPNGGGRAVDLNDAGVVLGFGGPTGNFRYLATSGTTQPLGTSSNQSDWEARTISPSGRMFAAKFVGSGNAAGELFQSTAPTFLYPSNTRSEIRDANSHNTQVGSYSPNTSTNNRPAIFNGSTATIINVPNIQFGSAAGINDRGTVILSAYISGPQTGYHPYLYDNGVVIPLNSLIDNASQWSSIRGHAINNRGQIIGQAQFDQDNNAATASIISGFRLDPIRSPGDTNYDDAVDFTDLLTLAQHYGQSGNGNVFWETGDFNYDWSIDFDDLLTIAQNYGSPELFTSEWASAQALVPEPVGFALAVTLMSHRRHRRR